MTVSFKEKSDDIKDRVLWLMMENYKDRISHKALEISAAGEPK